MPTEFSYAKTEELKKKLRAGTFDANLELIDLIRLGYDPIDAKEFLAKVVKSHKDDLYEEAKETKKSEERKNIAFSAIIIITSLIGLLGDNSGVIVLIAIIAACICGYYGNQEDPLPAMVGYTVATLIMPFACAFYFQGRSSFLNLEMLIPLLVSFVPGLLIKYILSKILPSD